MTGKKGMPHIVRVRLESYSLAAESSLRRGATKYYRKRINEVADLTNKNELIKYLKQNELWAKKSLGQNFLVDREVLNKIVKAAELKKTDTVIEIGPGFGVLTQELVKNAGKVIAIEKDDELAKKLDVRCQMAPVSANGQAEVGNVKNIEILNQDVLETDLTKLIKLMSNEADYKLVANIPYYITSKILEKFLSAENKPELIVLLVQKEVAERICAKPGDTSVLSIAVQFYGEPEIVDVVKSSSFWPQPKIDSAILKIKIKNKISNIKDMEQELFKVVRAGFRSRRKTLVNNLISGINLSREELFDILEKAGLDKNVRAQELSVDDWIELSGLII